MSNRIYMDNHSTTRVDPRVVEAMLPYFTELYGNAASRTHAFGRDAEEACEKARGQVAALIGSRPREIVFTSGATESNNLALRGVLELHRERGDHIVTVSTEHPSVLDPCRALEKTGRARVTYVGVGRDGLVDPDAVRSALTERTVLVSVMAANNEIGVLAPLREIAAIVRERGIFLHTDATQAVGKIPVDVEAMGIDLMSLTAHKMYGPKGCGALYVRGREPRVRLAPLLYGGGHERGMRSGTLNVPGVVGFGRACEIAVAERTDEAERVRELRDRLWAGLERELDGLHLNGHPAHRLPGNLNLTFAHVEADSLMAALPALAVSSGSACASATLEPSHVLRAIGLSDDAAHQTIRFGLGRFNTAAEVEQVLVWVVEAVRRLRASSPGYRIARRDIGAGA